MATKQWDVEVDVLIVGFGAAGVSAALQAAEVGVQILAIDRFSGGGATALSGGVVYAGGGTWVQQEAGISDTPEAMYEYLQREVDTVVRPETLQRFVNSSPEMILWLGSHGVPFEGSLCPYKTSYPSNHHYLYYSGSECSGGFSEAVTPAPRGHRVKGKGVSGKKLFYPLAKSASGKGVRLFRQTKAQQLVTDANSRVIGVRCSTLKSAPNWVQRAHALAGLLSAKPGLYSPYLRKMLDKIVVGLENKFAQELSIGARAGVILCAGGFIANTAMVRQWAPQYRGGLALGTAGDDGSGIAMGVAAGGSTALLSKISAWRFITPPSALLSAILIDKQGCRVIDESRYGAAVGQELIENHSGKGWLLVDADLLEKAKEQLKTQTLAFQWLQARSLVHLGIHQGNTLEDVAIKAGIDAQSLYATVSEHNRAAESGQPDPAGKPAAFVIPQVKAPFTLLDVSIKPSLTNPCPMLTLGGLRINEDTGMVLDDNGAVIDGLYAAGRTAVGICSNSYVSGLSLADCIFSGRRAGKNAAMQGNNRRNLIKSNSQAVTKGAV
ncbi:MAG: FAD-binding protein [Mycobacteriaceae bacterium]